MCRQNHRTSIQHLDLFFHRVNIQHPFANKNQNINMNNFEDIQVNQVTPPIAHNRKTEAIFVTPIGTPYKFFLVGKDDSGKEVEAVYKERITQHGGTLIDSTDDPLTLFLAESQEILNRNLQTVPNNRQVYRLSFIDDCITEGIVLPLENYTLLVDTNAQVYKMTPVRSYFTKEEDNIIAETYRLLIPTHRPVEINTHIHKKYLPHRTVYSIKSRYNEKIRKSLKYYYQSDPDSKELLRDVEGNYVRVYINDADASTADDKTSEEPLTSSTLPGRVRYSAKDDFQLCSQILKYNVRESNINDVNDEDLKVNSSIFQELADSFPHHSKKSWSERYAKWVSAYGVGSYYRYYQARLENHEVPEPVSNLVLEKGKYAASTALRQVRNIDSDDEVLHDVLVNAKKRKHSSSVIPISSTTSKSDLSRVFLQSLQRDSPPIDPEKIEKIGKDAYTKLLKDVLAEVKIFDSHQEWKSTFKNALGVKDYYLTFLLDVTSGNLKLIVQIISNYLEDNTQYLTNFPGVFLPRHDIILLANENKDEIDQLIKYHSLENVEKRRKYLF